MRDLVMNLTEAPSTTKAFWQYKLMGDSLREFIKLRSQVEEYFGDDLDKDDLDPHVTVLYMGKVPTSDLASIQSAGRDALTNAAAPDGYPFSVYASGAGVTFFPMTVNSEGRQPIVLDIQGPVETLNMLLLRALASYVTKDQFPVFRAHACLGYLKRKLTADEYVYLRRFGKSAYGITFKIDEVLLTAPGEGEWRVPVGPPG